MKTVSMSKGATPENYVRALRLSSPVSSQVYLSILNGFQHFVAEKAEDKSASQTTIRQWLKDRGTNPVIPNRSNRKQPFSFDKKSYKQRHRIENAFCRLKDFRRIATRYDRLARNFLASVCLVAAIVWWIL